MPTLTIQNFSCLKEATFDLAHVNVIIGPQGSGKSVTTKLLYFFTDILNNYTISAERGDSIDDYKRSISKQFGLWFPASAWGSGRFKITYTAGDFDVRILRRMRSGKYIDDVSITFSDWFSDFYNSVCELYVRARESGESDLSNNTQVSDSFEKLWGIRNVAIDRIHKALRDEYFSQQTFIPAGRAFFTSIGRLVAGFEQSGSLDPITVKFARLFATLRDRKSRIISHSLEYLGAEFMEKRSKFMSQLFGGQIKYEDDTEFVETNDGRKIPFSALSSGQQELWPMWSLLDYFGERDAYWFRQAARSARRPRVRFRELVYIEEPEAHLFPSAQSLLMEFLIGLILSERNGRSLIITTHSPYIMSKLNVFLKAGQLARRKKKNQEINEIVPRECWLNEKQLSAFAINDGVMIDLLEEESGLIDGCYLDQVSEDISRQFSKLLKIESEI